MKRLQKKESRYWNDGDWENHMRICHEFLVNYEGYLTNEEKANWNIKIAGTFIQLKSYLLAVEYLQKGIPYADGRLKSFGYGQLGRSYIDLGEYDKAIQSYSDAVKYAPSKEAVVAHTNSKGYVYFKAGRYKESRETYKKALSIFSKDASIDSIQYRILQSNLASVDFAQGLNDKGMQRLYMLEQNFKFGDSWFHAEVYGKMLPILIEQEKCDEAGRVLQNWQRNLRDDKVSEDRLRFLEYKIKQLQLCEGAGIGKVQQEYLLLNEALKQQTLDRLIIIEKLQRDELKKRLKLVSDNLKLKKASEKQYIKLMVVSVSLLVLVLIGAYVWWRSMKSRQQRKEKYLQLREELMRESELSANLKREMEAKELVNKKLELKQMLQSMNNNATLLEEIQGRLSSLRNKEEGIQEAVTDLLQFLKSHAGAQAINDVIEQNIEMIGGDFRDRLFEKHGDFTPSEIQLVLLLRIGLSTKEMALMKSVEPSSIRIFKHRLKTKLGLEKNQDLVSYIEKF
ncbi:MAG: hypothetical protein Crog2KO_31290 [Crocinitomicaceae bacterium]